MPDETREDLKGTFACPRCGLDTPHWHDPTATLADGDRFADVAPPDSPSLPEPYDPDNYDPRGSWARAYDAIGLARRQYENLDLIYAEREACAQLCAQAGAIDLAAAIRARKIERES